MRATARLAAFGIALAAVLVSGCETRKPVPEMRRDAGVQDASVSAAIARDAAADPTPVTVVTTEPSMPPAPAFDPEFTHRLRHLLDAIGNNDVALCHDVQLPRKAYVEDYLSKSLVKTWDRGADAAFKKSLAKLHRRQKRAELAFVSLEMPKAMTLLPAREHEGWTTATWRIEHTKLHAKPVAQAPGDAKDTVIDIARLIYWRGAWYIERL